MKYTYIYIVIKIICCLSIINNVFALVKEDLYNINITVSSKEITKEQQEQLITQAFYQTIQKVTGKPNTLGVPQKDQYLSKYAFNDTKPGQLMLNISFDAAAINQKLLQQNYKFLGEYRPLTIIWSKSTDINNNQELLKQISAVSKSHGLSIVYPMYDLLDLAALQYISTNELELVKIITQASKRYAADEIILISSENFQNNIRLNWRLISGVWQLSTDEDNYEQHAKVFIDNLMQYFIKIYANNHEMDDHKQVMIIRVDNIINLEDYARIENYLQNLPLIQHIQATLLEPGLAEFEVIASGGKDAIKKAIANSNLLSSINSPLSQSDNNSNINILLYQLHS